MYTNYFNNVDGNHGIGHINNISTKKQKSIDSEVTDLKLPMILLILEQNSPMLINNFKPEIEFNRSIIFLDNG